MRFLWGNLLLLRFLIKYQWAGVTGFGQVDVGFGQVDVGCPIPVDRGNGLSDNSQGRFMRFVGQVAASRCM